MWAEDQKDSTLDTSRTVLPSDPARAGRPEHLAWKEEAAVAREDGEDETVPMSPLSSALELSGY